VKKGRGEGGRGGGKRERQERQEGSCEEELASSLSLCQQQKERKELRASSCSILLCRFGECVRGWGGKEGGRDFGGRGRSGGQWRQQRLWNGKEGVFPLHLLLPPLPAAAMLFLSCFCER